ncbi:MAG: bifunctional phosphoribosylaminoimidazolecarboxamide formyltransferase/IMP cyclohydrolase [Propionibacteriaceae bacterium]|jgi:phosphoribosylaminoimidazolecarboxamide formyltransferase/IMP cyclohydrolase|nr:bifunctional phosphoribosylaminoimidazolecarboxamide formyltransferase/IMP cyclohydrolase [Propionibacteriaceae bacterium]
MERIQIRRALVSVYDKSGLAEIGKALAGAGAEIVSTGSTAAALRESGVPVTAVESLTGFPECFDGRVKTLHPKIHGGLLADRRLESHRAQAEALEIPGFDLLVSNLYPFAQTVASGAGYAEIIEQIDIGGPAMVRAAAKNHASVAVITSPGQYPELLDALAEGGFTLKQRAALAAAAFQHTAEYDVSVANWMAAGEPFPQWLGATWRLRAQLRYGENAHQQAALYLDGSAGLAAAAQLHGKEMSYNNYTDAQAAYRAAFDFGQPCAAIVKHANPCGIAVAADIATAYERAFATDPVSAYGSVVALNRPLSVTAAERIAKVFTEVVLAPGFEPGALELLAQKKNLRILQAPEYQPPAAELRPISGGLLAQQPDRLDAPGDNPANWQLAAGKPADPATLADLEFAWRACRCVKSNAILLAKGGAAVGIGMGQVNRVDSCRLAVARAGERAAGSAAASDAFFPFSDGPEILIAAGVAAIVQPGGSIRDEETIAKAQQAGITMYLTGTRHFFH